MLGNQRGFTLLEIIAVLVILGILAAVAVPKYIDLQEELCYRFSGFDLRTKLIC